VAIGNVVQLGFGGPASLLPTFGFGAAVVVAGPYYIDAAMGYVAGCRAGDTSLAGAAAVHVYLAGASVVDVYLAGASAAQPYVAGARAGDTTPE
jgi:hypothetical protein